MCMTAVLVIALLLPDTVEGCELGISEFKPSASSLGSWPLCITLVALLCPAAPISRSCCAQMPCLWTRGCCLDAAHLHTLHRWRSGRKCG